MILYTIYGSFLKWWENPHFTPQVLISFSRKTHGFVGETHQFRKPPCRVTSIYKLEHNHIIIISYIYIYICTIYYIVWKIVYIYIYVQSPITSNRLLAEHCEASGLSSWSSDSAEVSHFGKSSKLSSLQATAYPKGLGDQSDPEKFTQFQHQSCRNRFEKHTRSVSHPTCWCQCPLVFLQCLHFWNCVTSPGGCRNWRMKNVKVSVDPSCSVSISSINFTSVTERFDEKSDSPPVPWKLTWHWENPHVSIEKKHLQMAILSIVMLVFRGGRF